MSHFLLTRDVTYTLAVLEDNQCAGHISGQKPVRNFSVHVDDSECKQGAECSISAMEVFSV